MPPKAGAHSRIRLLFLCWRSLCSGAPSADANPSHELAPCLAQGFPIPTAKLRESDTALKALRAHHFFTKEGPRREEIISMGDLLRQEAEDAPGEACVKLLQQARSGKLKREVWEEQVTSMMVEGNMKRGHLATVRATRRRWQGGSGATIAVRLISTSWRTC